MRETRTYGLNGVLRKRSLQATAPEDYQCAQLVRFFSQIRANLPRRLPNPDSPFSPAARDRFIFLTRKTLRPQVTGLHGVRRRCELLWMDNDCV